MPAPLPPRRSELAIEFLRNPHRELLLPRGVLGALLAAWAIGRHAPVDLAFWLAAAAACPDVREVAWQRRGRDEAGATVIAHRPEGSFSATASSAGPHAFRVELGVLEAEPRDEFEVRPD